MVKFPAQSISQDITRLSRLWRVPFVLESCRFWPMAATRRRMSPRDHAASLIINQEWSGNVVTVDLGTTPHGRLCCSTSAWRFQSCGRCAGAAGDPMECWLANLQTRRVVGITRCRIRRCMRVDHLCGDVRRMFCLRAWKLGFWSRGGRSGGSLRLGSV